MALKTYPLNKIEYTAEDAALFNCPRSSGIWTGEDFTHSVVPQSNKVKIEPGLAWIKFTRFGGFCTCLSIAETVDLGVSDPLLDRIDSIMLEFDVVRNSVELIVKKGTAGSEAKPPEVLRNESKYELHLYHVMRKAGSVGVSEADITDIRPDKRYCGYMLDALSGIDDTLKKAGFAADSKAVGDKFSESEIFRGEITEFLFQGDFPLQPHSHAGVRLETDVNVAEYEILSFSVSIDGGTARYKLNTSTTLRTNFTKYAFDPTCVNITDKPIPAEDMQKVTLTAIYTYRRRKGV